MLCLLASAGHLARGYCSADEFLHDPLPASPCCLLLDMRMPGVDGFDLVRQLEQRGESLPLIFMSGHGTIPATVRAMRAGAFEFLTKPLQADQLLAAVEVALDMAQRQLAARAAQSANAQSLGKLTPREREVLELLVSGLLNKQIAAQLGISEITVKVHKRRVMDKLNTKTRADMVRAAVKWQINSVKA